MVYHGVPWFTYHPKKHIFGLEEIDMVQRLQTPILDETRPEMNNFVRPKRYCTPSLTYTIYWE